MMKQITQKIHTEALWATALLIVSGGFMQFVMFPEVKDLALSQLETFSLVKIDVAGLALALLQKLSWKDYIVPIMLFASVLWLIRCYLNGSWKALFEWVFESDWRTKTAFVIIAVFSLKGLLSSGVPVTVDAPTHLIRAFFTWVNFRDGYLPVWNNFVQNGDYFLSLYSFLSYYCVAVLQFVLKDVVLATKCFLFGVSLFHAWILFDTVKMMTGRKDAAFFATLVFSFSYYYLYTIFWAGLFQLPLVILSITLMIREMEIFWTLKSFRVWMGVRLGIWAAMALCTHSGYASIFFAQFGCYVILRNALLTESKWKDLFLLAISSAIVFLAVSAFAWMPLVFDHSYADHFPDHPLLLKTTFEFWHIRWLPLLIPKFFFTGYSAYLGLPLLAAFGCALFVIIKQPDRLNWVFLVMVFLSFLTLAYERNQIFFQLWLTFAVVQVWTKMLGRIITAPLVILISLLNNAGFNYFSTFQEPVIEKVRVLDRIEGFEDSSVYSNLEFSTIHTGNQENCNVFLSAWSKFVAYELPNSMSYNPETASKNYFYQLLIGSKWVAGAIREGHLGDAEAAALVLINVRNLLFTTSSNYFNPQIKTSDAFEWSGEFLRLKNEVPILFSTRVEGLDKTQWNSTRQDFEFSIFKEVFEHDYSNAYFKRDMDAQMMVKAWVDLMELNLSQASARQFIADLSLPPYPDVNAGLEILSVSKDIQRQSYHFRIDGGGYVRVPTSYYDFLRVELDGNPVKIHRSAMNFVIVEVPEGGIHHLEFLPYSMSNSRRWGLLITVLTICGLALCGLLYLASWRLKRESMSELMHFR